MVAARQQRRRRWGVLVLLAAYVGYLGLGAVVLQALERPAEVQAAQNLLQEHWGLLANHTCLQGPALQRLIEVSPGAPGALRPLGLRGRRCLRPGERERGGSGTNRASSPRVTLTKNQQKPANFFLV